MRVTDEGKYWDTEDKDILIQKVSFINKKMDEIEEVLSSISEDLRGLSTEETIKLLEEILIKKMKE